MSKKDTYFSMEPIIAIGYSNQEYVTYIHTLVVHRVYFLCFVLTIYYTK